MADQPRRRDTAADVGRGQDAGTATAELAVALPAVVLALVAVVAAGQAVVGQVECVDAARAAARAAARGDSPDHVVEVARAAAGSGAVDVTVGGTESVVVTVHRELRLVLPGGPRLDLGARAVAQREQPAASRRTPLDSGSATVLVLATVLLGMVLVVSGLAVGAVTVARHRAQSAADLAALAGAAALTRGGSPVQPGGRPGPCTAAAAVAVRNGAQLVACSISPGAGAGTVLVRAQVTPAGPAARWGSVRAVARAGPAGSR